jgi:hypothetical protein
MQIVRRPRSDHPNQQMQLSQNQPNLRFSQNLPQQVPPQGRQVWFVTTQMAETMMLPQPIPQNLQQTQTQPQTMTQIYPSPPLSVSNAVEIIRP